MKKFSIVAMVILFCNFIIIEPSHANPECPSSAAWPCAGSTIDSSTPMPGGGGSIRFMSINV